MHLERMGQESTGEGIKAARDVQQGLSADTLCAS